MTQKSALTSAEHFEHGVPTCALPLWRVMYIHFSPGSIKLLKLSA